MHKKFDNKVIEKKWQKNWKDSGIYDVGERDTSKEKEYILVELPYPSGNLHVGHWYSFAVPDIYVRHGRMQGKQMLYPMGFDAFGLPAENAAIKRDINPKEWTESNIAYMKEQLGSMGVAFSWDKTANTTDESYYKWTQWMFTEFFKNDIAYRGTGLVNWCPGCNTVIANEQIINTDECERSGDKIEKKMMPQWMFRITKYADRLLDDLDTIEWPEHIKEAQRQWIGRSEGAELTFTLSTGDSVDVFTTRPDTLYGATYMVFAPEHALVEKNKDCISNWDEVSVYIEETKKRAEQDRLDATKEKTGVKLEGITATNPASGEEMPVYIADYVLAGYGTGAIMAVPAHDERDYAFAKKFDIEIKQVVQPVFGEVQENEELRNAVTAFVRNPEDGRYLFIDSKEFNRITKVYGGIEEGEDVVEAAMREVGEETGYKTKYIKHIGGQVESHFYHPGKKVNRNLTCQCVLLEIINEVPNAVNPEELEKHTPVWMTLEEAEKAILEDREAHDVKMLKSESVYTEMSILMNSGEFDGIDSEEAKRTITEKVGGKMTNTYRLRDWSVGRQRYWGVPIPIVYDPEGKAHPIPKEHLPWILPEDVDFRPTGEPPLAKSVELQKRTEEIFGAGWTPEVETMDTFLDSSWCRQWPRWASCSGCSTPRLR